MKLQDISLILAEYVKVKIEFKIAEEAFDSASLENVDEALTHYENTEKRLAEIACAIVDNLIEDM